MEAETPLLARISDFGLALLPYWWLLVTGGVLLVEPMIETLVPQAWKNTVDQRWSKETRHKNFRWASVGALLIASFLAFDDISTRNRVLQRDLVQATRERDEAKRERDEIIKQLPGYWECHPTRPGCDLSSWSCSWEGLWGKAITYRCDFF